MKVLVVSNFDEDRSSAIDIHMIDLCRISEFSIL